MADAKTLSQRLQYHSSAADSLISDAANLQTKLQAFKEVGIQRGGTPFLCFLLLHSLKGGKF